MGVLERLGRWAEVCLHGLTLFLLGGLLLLCGFSTAKVYTTSEHVIYVRDSLLWNLLAAAALGLLLWGGYCLLKRLRRRFPQALGRLTHRAFQRLCLGAVFCGGILFVLSTQFIPRADPEVVLHAAAHLRAEEFAMFRPQGGYVAKYPHQAGVVVLIYLLSNLFGDYNFLVFQLLNVFALTLAYRAFLSIQEELGAPEAVRSLTAALCVGFVPLLLYVNFVYGNLLGLWLALEAILMELRFFRRGGWHRALLSALCIALAAILKNNYLIFLIAMAIVALLELLRRKDPRILALGAALILGYVLLKPLPPAWIQAKTGVDFGDDCHPLAWVAMGLQEGPLAPGWYNAFNSLSFQDSGYDRAVQETMAREAIEERLEVFRADPDYARSFFAQKLASQWAEPTFEGWLIQTGNTQIRLSPAINRFLAPRAEEAVSVYLNVLQFAVLLGALLSVVLPDEEGRRGIPVFQTALLGGFLFHLLWEAKSQYTLFYFVLLLPMAAQGFVRLAQRLRAAAAAQGLRGRLEAALPGRDRAWGAGALALVLLLGCVSYLPQGRVFFHRDGETQEYRDYLALQRSVLPQGSGVYTLEAPVGGGLTAPAGGAAQTGEAETLKLLDHGSYCTVQFTASKEYLTLYGGEEAEGAGLVSYPYLGTAAQRWRVTPSGVPGQVYLTFGFRSAVTRKEDGALCLSAFTGGEAQTWQLARQDLSWP